MAEIPILNGRWIVAAIAVSILIDAALLLHTGLRIAPSWTLVGFGAWAMAASAICYGFRSPTTSTQRIARDFVEGVSLFALISLLGAIASYPLAAGHHALVDHELERVDLELHFHWTVWYQMVVAHPWLQSIERAAYMTIFVTPALIIGYLASTGRRAENRLFVATFWIAAVMTLTLFPLFPAAGPFATLWHGSRSYMPLSALYQEQLLFALRHHTIRSLDLGALHGLVCAPSFHATSAVIYVVTACRFRALRWPGIAVNVFMLLATPVEGTHYLVDILSGGVVGGVALCLAPVLIGLTTPRTRSDADFERSLFVVAR